MRTNGIDEKYCTGKVPDIDKFRKWAETVPATAGNPLYHWTILSWPGISGSMTFSTQLRLTPFMKRPAEC